MSIGLIYVILSVMMQHKAILTSVLIGKSTLKILQNASELGAAEHAFN